MTAGDASAWAELLDAHAAAAGTLSRLLLAPPDEPMLAALREVDLATHWPLADESPGDDGADSALGQGLRLLTSGVRAAVPELTDDYRALFVGPASLRACPYESVYTSVDHLTFEAQTLAVRRWYAEYGLVAPRLHREPDDHLGLELAFVSHLCLRALDAGASDAAVEPLARFLHEHVLTFLPRVAEHIVGGAETDFYRGVGYLLEHAGARLAAEFQR